MGERGMSVDEAVLASTSLSVGGLLAEGCLGWIWPVGN
jgi:hypothetical protein